MSIETEIKVHLIDFPAFRRQIDGLHPTPVSERHFEDNYILDYADGRIRLQQSLLRVRFSRSGSYLTFKGPPRPEGLFKVREELETSVGDPSVVLRILESLGLSTSFRYQKYRQEFSVAQKSGLEVHLALDETPIGDYAEFEGSEEAIRGVTDALGIDEPQFLRASYYTLYLQFCRDRGEAPNHMVFPGGQGARSTQKGL